MSNLAAIVIVVFLKGAGLWPFTSEQLRPDYYAGVCPNLEGIVRSSVKQSMVKSPISAPATLRLFFHDCAATVLVHIDASNKLMAVVQDWQTNARHACRAVMRRS